MFKMILFNFPQRTFVENVVPVTYIEKDTTSFLTVTLLFAESGYTYHFN